MCMIVGMRYIRRQLEAVAPVAPLADGQPDDDDDDDGFFVQTLPSSGQLQLGQYVASASTQLAVLHALPTVKAVYIKTNTALAASAACERLFNAAEVQLPCLVKLCFYAIAV